MEGMGWFWAIVIVAIVGFLFSGLRKRGERGGREDNIIRPLFGLVSYELGERTLMERKPFGGEYIGLASITGLKYHVGVLQFFFHCGTVRFRYDGREYVLAWVKEPKEVVRKLRESSYEARSYSRFRRAISEEV